MTTTKFSPGDLEGTFIASRSAAENYTSPAFECGAAQEVSLQLIWATADHADATAEIWGSVDGTNFEPFADASYTLATAAGNHIWKVLLGSIPYIQLVFVKGSNTTGTFSVLYRREMPV